MMRQLQQNGRQILLGLLCVLGISQVLSEKAYPMGRPYTLREETYSFRSSLGIFQITIDSPETKDSILVIDRWMMDEARKTNRDWSTEDFGKLFGNGSTPLSQTIIDQVAAQFHQIQVENNFSTAQLVRLVQDFVEQRKGYTPGNKLSRLLKKPTLTTSEELVMADLMVTVLAESQYTYEPFELVLRGPYLSHEYATLFGAILSALCIDIDMVYLRHAWSVGVLGRNEDHYGTYNLDERSLTLVPRNSSSSADSAENVAEVVEISENCSARGSHQEPMGSLTDAPQIELASYGERARATRLNGPTRLYRGDLRGFRGRPLLRIQ